MLPQNGPADVATAGGLRQRETASRRLPALRGDRDLSGADGGAALEALSGAAQYRSWVDEGVFWSIFWMFSFCPHHFLGDFACRFGDGKLKTGRLWLGLV